MYNLHPFPGSLGDAPACLIDKARRPQSVPSREAAQAGLQVLGYAASRLLKDGAAAQPAGAYDELDRPGPGGRGPEAELADLLAPLCQPPSAGPAEAQAQALAAGVDWRRAASLLLSLVERWLLEE